jgi:hypothetical protein
MGTCQLHIHWIVNNSLLDYNTHTVQLKQSSLISLVCHFFLTRRKQSVLDECIHDKISLDLFTFFFVVVKPSILDWNRKCRFKAEPFWLSDDIFWQFLKKTNRLRREKHQTGQGILMVLYKTKYYLNQTRLIYYYVTAN